MSTHVRLVLLLSAYAPALVVAALLQPQPPLAIGLTATAAVLFATLRLVIRRTRENAVFDGATGASWVLHRARLREAELAAFLLGYLLPFVQWNTSPAPLAFLALPLLILIVLYLNWNIGVLHLNPTLLLLGWRVVDMTESSPFDGETQCETRVEGQSAIVLCHGGVPGPDETLPGLGWRVAKITSGSRDSLWVAEWTKEGGDDR